MIKHTDVVEGLKQIQSESVDCIILDPPYNIGKDYGNNKTNLQTTEYISWAQQWLTECERILKPDGTMYVYGFSEILAHLSVNISLNQRWLIWHYTNKTVPRLNFWQRTHESILCCWKEEKSFSTRCNLFSIFSRWCWSKRKILLFPFSSKIIYF